MPTLDWLNRDAAFRIATEVPYRTLELVSEHVSNQPSQQDNYSLNSIGRSPNKSKLSKNTKNNSQARLNWANTNDADRENQSSSLSVRPPAPTHDNLLIQGDNLEALKALLPFYRGQVKCIFIDPPYNTKSAFEHYDDNLEHAQWLTMMLPRLQLLRELLSGDGSIWVTIDDNEGHYLKVLMDEAFGRRNFVANVVWQKKYTVANDAKWLADTHDHVLVYARSKEAWRPYRLPRTEEMNDRYRNPDNHPKGPWKATPLYAKRNPSEKEAQFSFTFQNGYVWKPPAGTTARFPIDELARMDSEDEIWFGKNGDAAPSRKTFLGQLTIESPPAATIWTHSDAGHNHEAREESKLVDANEVFDTPKPERLIQRTLDLATKVGDLILDSFLGSGTTAAVAQKMNRRWIGIEMGDHAQTHCVSRLQKVIDGEEGGISKAVNWQGGGSFRFMKLGATIFDETGAINSNVRFATLAAFIWMQETKTPWGKLRHGSTSSPRAAEELTPFIGTHNGVDYFLLYNGILGDKRPQAGNVLTGAVLQDLNERFPSAGRARVIYGEATRLGEMRLASERITFKQIPYDVGNQ
jgi:adenine-specific DNA-methyltransferase